MWTSKPHSNSRTVSPQPHQPHPPHGVKEFQAKLFFLREVMSMGLMGGDGVEKELRLRLLPCRLSLRRSGQGVEWSAMRSRGTVPAYLAITVLLESVSNTWNEPLNSSPCGLRMRLSPSSVEIVPTVGLTCTNF